MPTFYDKNGTPHVLTNEIGRGGEGTVYICGNNPKIVAKIYHEPINAEKAEKLLWMAANKNETLLKISAWVLDVIYDAPDGKVVGFLMPNVKAKEIHELYSLKSRRVYFPEANWQFLLHTAANVARAFFVLHKHNHIIGDVNHGNLVVLHDGTVKLIDCDSYSIETDKRRYRCDVGVGTHLAPELQGVDLGEITREFKHDNFGLAVIIFQLLFLGRHPFSGNYLGAEDKSLEDCIRERRFAYGDNSKITMIRQPPGTLSLSEVSPRIATLFEKAFFTEGRPKAKEWVEAIEDLSENLQQCAVHVGHYFYTRLVECPWCRIESQTGLLLFPFINQTQDSSGKFNIFSIEKLVNQMNGTQFLPFHNAQFTPTQAPSIDVLSERTKKRYLMLKILVVQVILLSLLSFLVGGGWTFLAGIFLFIGCIAVFHYFQQPIESEYKNQFDEKRRIWEGIEENWIDFNQTSKQFGENIETIKGNIVKLRDLEVERINNIRTLAVETRKNMLNQHLSSYLISDSQIEEIVPAQIETFARYGIKSAADLDANRLESLLAIEPEIKPILSEWRSELEKDFVFNADEDIPKASKRRLELEFRDRHHLIESEIERLLGGLHKSSLMLKRTRQQLVENAEQAYQEVNQALRNQLAIGGIAPLVLALIFITFIVPVICTSLLYSSPSPSYSASYPTVFTQTAAKAPSTRAVPVAPGYPIDENISDTEISRLAYKERIDDAGILYFQGQSLNTSREYFRAEAKLKLAYRLDRENIGILYALSQALFEQRKFGEAANYLEQDLMMSPDDQIAILLLAKCYNKLGKFNQANELFKNHYEENSDSYEFLSNWAFAQKNLKQYTEALANYRSVIEINPNDVEAHFGLGYCLFKTGRKLDAREEFRKLLDLDETKAYELNSIINQ